LSQRPAIGSGVPPAREMGRMRSAYRVTEKCRRSATMPMWRWHFYNRSSAVVAHASVSRGRQANPVLTYETAIRRFLRCTAPLAHTNGGWFFVMHRTLAHTNGWWFYQWNKAIRRWRQPPKDGCIIIAPGWLAYLGSVAKELIYRRRAVV